MCDYNLPAKIYVSSLQVALNCLNFQENKFRNGTLLGFHMIPWKTENHMIFGYMQIVVGKYMCAFLFTCKGCRKWLLFICNGKLMMIETGSK